MREKTIYEKIAKKYNTTPEEVRREMQIAIDAGFDNPDPDVQEEWKKMTLKGDRPTPEEVINYAVKQLKAINEQIQNIAQKKDTLCRRMYN